MSRTLLFGLLFAALNAFMLAAMSLFAKLLTQSFGPIEVTFFRNGCSFILLAAWIVATKQYELLKTKRPVAHLIRCVVGNVGLVLGMWGISLLPLTISTTLLFTSPLFVVLLSYPILREPVGPYRLTAVLFGFTGVLIVINPFSSGYTPPLLGVLLGLSWGFLAGCVDICLRWMGRTENAWSNVFYFVLFGTLATSLHWPWAEVQTDTLGWNTVFVIVGLGLTGVIALLSKAQSFKMGEASLISPVLYTMIIWTALFDYLLWEKLPAWNTALGAAIIISSNLFILYREKIKKSV
ncbi:MAG: EamA family transporter [Alphaproteobacteria bacterium]|nr:EamA family transporter [Alphaproteobacteria bacterium]